MNAPRRPRHPFPGLTACAIAGILLADRWSAPLEIATGAVAVSAVLLFWRRSHASFWLLVITSFVVLHTLSCQFPAAAWLRQALHDERQVVHATGLVLDEPRMSASQSTTFRVGLEHIAINGTVRSCSARTLAIWEGKPPAPGDRIAFTGSARPIPGPRNPGQFDYAAYLKRQGIFSEIVLNAPRDGEVIKPGAGLLIYRLALRARWWMQSRLTLGIGDDSLIAPMISGMILGAKAQGHTGMDQLFRETGTVHLFAVSGLNVGMFAVILTLACSLFQLGRRATSLIIIPLLFFYALVTGLSASSVRAAIMAAVLLGSDVFDRPSILINNVAAAAFILLLFDSNNLFDVGFQFSFTVVLAIILLADLLRGIIIRPLEPDAFVPRCLVSRQRLAVHAASGWLVALLSVSLAAWIGSTPWTLAHYHMISMSSVLANMCVVPLAFAVLLLGTLAVVAGSALPWVAVALNNMNWAIAKLILAVVTACAQLPGAYFYLAWPPWRNSEACEITVLDVRRGGAASIRAGRMDWLVDCGRAFDFEAVVEPYLRSRGVNRLDGFILTHGDAAHLGGAIAALRAFAPRHVVDSPLVDRSPTRRAVWSELHIRGQPRDIRARGDRIQLSAGTSLRILYPPPDLQRAVADDKVLVLLLESGGWRVLFTSDAGFFVEQWLVDHEPDLRADILVKGRHAADFSGTSSFLTAVRPRAIVSTSVDFPPRERIPDDWAQEVAARGIRLFRLDETGAVSIHLRAGECVMKSFLGDQILTARKE